MSFSSLYELTYVVLAYTQRTINNALQHALPGHTAIAVDSLEGSPFGMLMLELQKLTDQPQQAFAALKKHMLSEDWHYSSGTVGFEFKEINEIKEQIATTKTELVEIQTTDYTDSPIRRAHAHDSAGLITEIKELNVANFELSRHVNEKPINKLEIDQNKSMVAALRKELTEREEDVRLMDEKVTASVKLAIKKLNSSIKALQCNLRLIQSKLTPEVLQKHVMTRCEKVLLMALAENVGINPEKLQGMIGTNHYKAESILNTYRPIYLKGMVLAKPKKEKTRATHTAKNGAYALRSTTPLATIAEEEIKQERDTQTPASNPAAITPRM